MVARDRLRILIVSWNIPRADAMAGDRRLLAMLGMLARRDQVDFTAVGTETSPGDVARHVAALAEAGVRVVDLSANGWIAGLLRRRRYDIVLFETYGVYLDCGEIVRKTQPWARRVIDSVDVHFAREGGEVALGLLDPAEAERRKADEIRSYRDADSVIVITDEDRTLLESIGGMPELFLVPIIVPIRPRPEGPRRREVLFVGSFWHPPNAVGLRWFLENAWPSVRRRIPDAVLTVVGSRATPEILALHGKDGVELAGFVPETGPYLNRAAVSIAPLTYGGGMKGKVSEALASGVPVVTTSVGAQGFGIIPGVHAIVADDPSDFADGVARLLSDPAEAEALGRSGQGLVRDLLSPDAVEGRFLQAIDRLAPGRRAVSPTWWCRSTLARIRDMAKNTIRSGVPRAARRASRPGAGRPRQRR